MTLYIISTDLCTPFTYHMTWLKIHWRGGGGCGDFLFHWALCPDAVLKLTSILRNNIFSNSNCAVCPNFVAHYPFNYTLRIHMMAKWWLCKRTASPEARVVTRIEDFSSSGKEASLLSRRLCAIYWHAFFAGYYIPKYFLPISNCFHFSLSFC